MTIPKTEQEQFGFLMGRIVRHWRAEINRRLAPHGLTESRWMTLLHLSRLPEPVTQKELACSVGVQGPTLVKTLDWLEGEGLIERRALHADRRAKSIHLQEKAACNLSQIKEAVKTLRAEIFADIDDAELAVCLQVFAKINKKLNTLHGFQ